MKKKLTRIIQMFHSKAVKENIKKKLLIINVIRVINTFWLTPFFKKTFCLIPIILSSFYVRPD